jgi:hypothetical protein
LVKIGRFLVGVLFWIGGIYACFGRFGFFSGRFCFALNHKKTTFMLTIQIDDAQLEQRIVEAAKAICQTGLLILQTWTRYVHDVCRKPRN